MNVQKLESMAPEFHNMTEAFKKTSSVLPSILLDKDGQPSPPKVQCRQQGDKAEQFTVIYIYNIYKIGCTMP